MPRRTIEMVSLGLIVCVWSGCDSSRVSGDQGSANLGIQELAFKDLFVLQEEVHLNADEADPIGTVTDLVATPTSFVLVDRQQSNLKIFDRDGNLRRSVGRQGDGPGEFKRLTAITSMGHDHFAVLDDSRQTVSVWDSSGAAVDEWRISGWKLYGMDRVPDTDRIVVTGILSGTAVSDSEVELRLHEFEVDGTLVRSFRPTPVPTHWWKRVFDGMFLACVDDAVVSGSFNTNRLHVASRDSDKGYWTEIGGDWYEPNRWPNDGESPVSKAERISSWANEQVLMTRLYAVERSQFIARFQAYEEDGAGDRVYHYLLADVEGRSIAVTDASPINILKTSGDTCYGSLMDEVGEVTVYKFELNETALDLTADP